jgi:hypothetical protein
LEEPIEDIESSPLNWHGIPSKIGVQPAIFKFWQLRTRHRLQAEEIRLYLQTNVKHIQRDFIFT